MRYVETSFLNSRGDTLSGRLELPLSGRPSAYALFAHSFTGHKKLNIVTFVSRALAAANIAVLRFDFAGLGESDGVFCETDFSTQVDDLLAAARHLEQSFQAPQLLVGHSLGGSAALFAAARLPSCRGVAVINSPGDPAHVTGLFRDHLDAIRHAGSAVVTIGGKQFTIRREFIDDVEAMEPEKVFPALKIPVLILHSPNDEIVGIENASYLYSKLRHPKSFISLEGADHMVSKKADAAYAGSVIAAWSARYLEMHKQDELPTEKSVVTRTRRGSYTTDVRAGGHVLIADEPASVGGDDYGPTPYGLLLAALGSCTSMTLRMVADQKGIPLEEAQVHLSHERIHAADCADCESTEGKVAEITREIRLTGNLSEAERSLLLSVADRCPVHKTLRGEIVIRTRELPEIPDQLK